MANTRKYGYVTPVKKDTPVRWLKPGESHPWQEKTGGR